MKKRVLALVLAVVLLVGMSGVFAASGKFMREVKYNDITIMLDGRPITLKDANGKEVEPFTIEGTTYVPIRAVSEAFGYEVEWDNENSNVLIGNVATPKYIFYMIGDGMGFSHRQLAEYYMKSTTGDNSYLLAMNDMPVSSFISTYSSNTYVTDSAAAGTALATGMKTNNGVISMNEDGTESYKTITEALQEIGMAIGLITTVRVTHATPASFGANIIHRDLEDDIAVQFLEHGWDFIAGGGYNKFADKTEGGKRPEGNSLLADFEGKGYTIDMSLNDYTDTDFSAIDKYLGIYEADYITEEIIQQNSGRTAPALAQMTKDAIEMLSKDPDGFFMMVEGGQIDQMSHDNDTAATLYETLGFDNAVQVAVDFYNAHPDETLIIVTSDHETGGLSLGYNTYSFNYAKLADIKSTVKTSIDPLLKKGDFDGYVKAIAETWNLELTEEDAAYLQRRINEFDLQGFADDYGITVEMLLAYMGGSKTALGIGGYIASPLLSRFTKIAWTTQAHTGESVPLTAMGVSSLAFTSCRDNTDVPNTIAMIMNVEIGK